jgi:hypothetical protein
MTAYYKFNELPGRGGNSSVAEPVPEPEPLKNIIILMEQEP